MDSLSMEEPVARVAAFVQSGTPHQHVVLNVDKLVKASRDPGLRRIINDCALISVDGMPAVWAARLLGKPLRERVAGIDLFESRMARAVHSGWRVFLLARAEVVCAVMRIYEQQYPGLTVVGARNGDVSAGQEQGVAEQIAASRADLLFVAISSSQKAQFLERYQVLMRVPFAVGVGGTFDVAAGKCRRGTSCRAPTPS